MGAYRAALAALLVVAACGGNPFVDSTVDPVIPTDPTEPTPAVGDKGVKRMLRKGSEALPMRNFEYDGTTLSIDMAGVSSSGQFGTF